MISLRNPVTHMEADDFKGNSKLNWLRAAVLGANDGIVSVASVMLGVAGAASATGGKGFILTAGVAALVAGALSMAAGEYVSVSAQRDTERALLAKERLELATMPDEELEELTQLYEKKGLSRSTAEIVARELTARDAFAAHVDAELKIDPDDLTNPLHAAYASAAAFFAGGVIPIFAVMITSEEMYLLATFGATVLALMVTGALAAYVTGAGKRKAALRVVVGGIGAMIVTFLVGKIFGIAVI